MNALVFGASAGIGRSLCRELAAQGRNITAISRDIRDLEAERAHCSTVHGVEIDCVALDAADPHKVFEVLTEYISNSDRFFHALFFPVGGAVAEDTVRSSADSMESTLHSNLTSIMTAISVLLPRMATDGNRAIVGFGSIAAIRGRSTNVAYAAAKRGLESYFESLRHDLSRGGIHVQFYRLGYVATQQSFGMTTHTRPIRSDEVARAVINGLNDDLGIRSLPRYWSVAAVLLRGTPWALFRRMRF